MSSVIFVITYNNVVGVARLMRAWVARRARTLMIDRAVQLPPRGDGRPRSLSALRGGVRALAGEVGQDLAELLRTRWPSGVWPRRPAASSPQ